LGAHKQIDIEPRRSCHAVLDADPRYFHCRNDLQEINAGFSQIANDDSAAVKNNVYGEQSTLIPIPS